jgi:hypothetical protein
LLLARTSSGSPPIFAQKKIGSNDSSDCPDDELEDEEMGAEEVEIEGDGTQEKEMEVIPERTGAAIFGGIRSSCEPSPQRGSISRDGGSARAFGNS